MLFRSGNVEAYVQAIEKIIALSDEELQQWSQKAPRSLERFDEERVIDRMLATLTAYGITGDVYDS